MTVLDRSHMTAPSPRVVSGALLSSDRTHVLMGLRKPSGKRPYLWELPGGKLEPGEVPEVALVREWLEELDFAIKPVAYVATAFLDVEISFHIDLYIVEPVVQGGEPSALDHTELRWIRPFDAVQNLPCSPAFYLHYPHLRRWMVL